MTKRRRTPSEHTLDGASDTEYSAAGTSARTPSPVTQTTFNNFSVNIDTDDIKRAIQQQAEVLSAIQATQVEHTDMHRQHHEAITSVQHTQAQHAQAHAEHRDALAGIKCTLDDHDKTLVQLVDSQKKHDEVLESILQGQKEQADLLQSILATQRTLIEKLDASTAMATATAASSENAFLDFNTKLDAVTAKTNRLDTIVAAAHTEVNNAKTTLKTKLAALDSKIENKFTNVDSKFFSIEATTAHLGAKVGAVQSKMTAVDEKVVSLWIKTAAVEAQLGAINTMLNAVETKQLCHTMSLDRIKTKVTALGTKTDTMAGDTVHLTAEVKKLASQAALGQLTPSTHSVIGTRKTDYCWDWNSDITTCRSATCRNGKLHLCYRCGPAGFHADHKRACC